MKRRAGFVSNSSSTSFCIFGVIVDDDWGCDDIEDTIWNLNRGSNDAETTCLTTERGVDTYYDTTFIGVEPSEIKDTETFGEFKIRVAKAISDVANVDVGVGSLSYYSDGGYDG